jgi:hypothetical protein
MSSVSEKVLVNDLHGTIEVIDWQAECPLVFRKSKEGALHHHTPYL